MNESKFVKNIIKLSQLFAIVAISLFLISCSSDSTDSTASTVSTTCGGVNDLTNIPTAYVTALTKYTTVNTTYLVYVCTEDSDGDGDADYMVVESTNRPEHKSYYWQATNALYEAYTFATNLYKYAATKTAAGYTGTPASAGPNMILEQSITLKMPISPAVASTKTATTFSTMGLALNGVSFFDENASPPDLITDELFTFDQCTGHPQNSGLYHYHADPICLIRDLGGSVTDNSSIVSGTTYSWIEDNKTNGGLLLGFVMDGFPVYGPVGDNHTDSDNASTPSIDAYNGHTHNTTEFTSGTYHYHIKTANLGGTNSTAFWITNEYYYGTPGSVTVR